MAQTCFEQGKYPDLTNWASILYIPAIIGREWEMGTA